MANISASLVCLFSLFKKKKKKLFYFIGGMCVGLYVWWGLPLLHHWHVNSFLYQSSVTGKSRFA